MIFFVILAGIFSRILVIFLNKKHFNNSLIDVGDSAGHLIFIRQLKLNRKSKFIDKYLIKDDAKISYPFLFHRIISLLPDKIIKQKYLINALIFILLIVFINLQISYSGKFSNVIDLLIFNILFFTSISNNVFFGPNISYIDFSERYFSKVLVSLYYYFSFIFLSENLLSYKIIVIFLIPLILSVSKFARQALLLPSFFIMIIYRDFSLIFLFGVFIVFLFDFKKFSYSIKHQLIHLYYYKNSFSRSLFVQKGLSKFVSLNDIIVLIKKLTFKNLKKIVFKEPIRSLIFLPDFFLAFIISYSNSNSFFSLESIFTLSVFIIYLITTFKRFSFLGESFRYIEYGFYILTPFIIVENLNNSNSIFVYILVLYNIFFTALYYIFLNRIGPNRFKKDFKKMILEYEFNDNSKVLTIPLRLVHGIILNTPSSGVWWQPESINKYVVDNIIEQYPFPSKDLFFFKNRYDINTIIIEKKYYKNLPWDYKFETLEKKYENNSFIIFNFL